MPMLNEHEKEQIRRAYFLEKKSMRQIAREQGHNRDTVRRVISNDLPKPYHLTHPKLAPIFGPYQERVDALLLQNTKLPHKQRYTAHKIFEVLCEAGYQGSEGRVRQYLAKRKQESQVPEVFLPLEFEPGQDAEARLGRSSGDHCRKDRNRAIFPHASLLFPSILRDDVSYPKPGKLPLGTCTSLQVLWRRSPPH